MRVLYLHQYFNTPGATGGMRSYMFAKELISRGHQVTMVCARTDKGSLELAGRPGDMVRQGRIDGIRIFQFSLEYSNYLSLPHRAWIFFRYALKSIILAMRLDYDIVFATSTPLTAGIPGIFARYLRGKPFVFEVRDLWPELPRAMGVVKNPLVLTGMSVLEWLTYRSACACIALAPGIKEGIVRRSPKDRRIVMIPNGCDLDLFRPGLCSELELPFVKPTDCLAVFIGAHGIANGLDAVLDAARILLYRGRDDIVFLFIGDGKLKPALVNRAKSEGLKNCRFIDPIPRNRLSQVVSCCDVGLMILDDVPAFYYGTSPNKFFDYISSGLPVVINYPGWMADFIREQNCGIAVPPRNPEAFADALCKLADAPKLRIEYGKNARRLAEKKFSRDKLANKFVDFLEDVYSNCGN